jgi:uncharacterized protein with HEPN domain
LRDQLGKRLFDAHRAARKVLTITDGMSRDDYLESEVTRLAVERLLEIVGEALSVSLRLKPELDVLFPDFRRAVGLRNRIIHVYGDINDVVIWDIVQSNLPPLERQLADLMREANEKGPES